MKINKKTKSGSAIAYALVIISVVSIILVSIMEFTSSRLRYGYFSQAKDQAFYVAEAGVYYYRWYLAHQTDGKTAQQIKDFWENGNPLGVAESYEADFSDPGGSVIGHYVITVTPPSAGSTVVIVNSEGWTLKYPNMKRTVKVRLRRPAWSEFMMLSNSNVSYGTTAFVQGKVFSNGGIHFDGVATNTVNSAVATYYDTDVDATKPGVWTSWDDEYNTTQTENVFQAGYNISAASKSFVSVSADLRLMHDESKIIGKGLFFAGNHQGWDIRLQGETFQARPVQNVYSGSGGSGKRNDLRTYVGGSSWTTYDIPDDGVIFIENNAWIEGFISNKHVTIASGNIDGEGRGMGNQYDIFIKNNITYSNYDGSSILGIVSENDIEVIENSADNLRIDGALLAIEGRVGRSNYGNTKNSLIINGAIASNDRSGFAYSNGTGYQTRTYIYDNDLLYTPPPYFPTGNQYLIDLWEEV